MNLKARRFFFYLFIAIFLVGGAYLIVSAQGLVFDFHTLSFSRTGGIFLDYAPSEAQVRVNGPIHEYSSVIDTLFGSGVFLNNLVPGDYRLEVSYPGYSPWEKTLTVEPGVVTAASFIVLWPVDWGAKKISDQKVSDFWLTGSGLILKTGANTLSFGDKPIKGDSVFLSDTGKNTVVTGNAKGYYLVNLAVASSAIPIELPAAADVTDWFFHPFDQNAVLAVGSKAVYSVNTATGKAIKLYTINGNQYSYKNGNELFIAQKDGSVFSANPFLQTEVTMPTGITDGITEMRSNADGDRLYLVDASGKFYEYDRSNGTSVPWGTLPGAIEKVSPALDDTRLALISKNGSLSILSVNDFKMDTEITRGTLWQISAAAPVTDFMWIPSAPNYGLLLENGNMVVSELGTAKPQNQYEVASGVSKALVNGTTLYFVKNSSLFEINLKQK